MTAHEDKNIYAGHTSAQTKTTAQDLKNGSLGSSHEICKRSAKNTSKKQLVAGADIMPNTSEKTRAGLVRVIRAPRGVIVENLEKTDMAVYRRFLRWQRLRGVQTMLPDQRVAKCYRVRVLPNVKVMKVPTMAKSFYGGLCVCGGVWACPVCAAKITERRRAELEGANDNGLSKFMVTWTLQHKRGDLLSDLLDDLAAGLRDVKNSRQYKNLIGDLQIVGTVTGLESTVSNVNGWHPHKHGLSFSKLPQSQIHAAEIRAELSRVFVSAMHKRRRYVHEMIGVNVQASAEIKKEYLAKFGEDDQRGKWTLAAELTKSPVKTGKDADHFHPLELVDMYQSGNIYAGRMFKEYAVTMKGRKQLFYSRGLRDVLGLDVELSDQEIAEREDQSAVMFAQLEPHHWTVIMQKEKRGQLLEVASTGNYNAFVTYMRALGCDDFGKG